MLDNLPESISEISICGYSKLIQDTQLWNPYPSLSACSVQKHHGASRYEHLAYNQQRPKDCRMRSPKHIPLEPRNRFLKVESTICNCRKRF